MVNPKLLDYILQQINAGISRDNIKQALATNGWSAQDVNAAFMAIDQPITTPGGPLSSGASGQLERSSKTRWPFITAIVIVAVMLIGAGVVFAAPSIRSFILSTFQSSPSITNEAPVGTSTSQEMGNPAASSTPNTITADEASSTCASFVKLYNASSLPVLVSGDTDATTNGEVTLLQKFLSFDVASGTPVFPNFQITGTFDAATQQAVATFEQQISSKYSFMPNLKTGQNLQPDTPGTFGSYGQEILDLSCQVILNQAQIAQAIPKIEQASGLNNITTNAPLNVSVSFGPNNIALGNEDNIAYPGCVLGANIPAQPGWNGYTYSYPNTFSISAHGTTTIPYSQITASNGTSMTKSSIKSLSLICFRYTTSGARQWSYIVPNQ